MTKLTQLDKVEMFELNEAYQKVLHWFFSFPDMETGLNDLASRLEISKNTAKRVVNDLIEEDFLNRKIYGKAWNITCNKNHQYNHTKKVAFNLEIVFDAYNGGLKNHILQVVENAKSIILFGSYRKGDDTENSDIDIAVEVENNQEPKIIPLGSIPKIGHRENVQVNLYTFCRNKIDINLFSNIANGIVLEGFLEVR